MTRKRRGKPPKPILVDVEKLGHRFRDEYLAGLKRLLATGQLKVQDHEQLKRLIGELTVIDWAVYVQPPPKQSSRAEHVVRYLARYMTGGPISNHRLVDIDDQQRVHFLVRSKDKSGNKEVHSLPAVDFVHQWSLHVLPKGYTKVRCFGQWAYTKRAAYQQLCDKLQPPLDEAVTDPEPGEPLAAAPEGPLCPVCKERGEEVVMKLIDFQRRPSWRELFYGPDHPAWFERVLLPCLPLPRAGPSAAVSLQGVS